MIIRRQTLQINELLGTKFLFLTPLYFTLMDHTLAENSPPFLFQKAAT